MYCVSHKSSSVDYIKALKMKKFLICIAAVTSFVIGVSPNQAQALPSGSSVGADFTSQDGTSFGINGRFGVSENISIRPKIIFSSKKPEDSNRAASETGTEYGIAATYDFKPSMSVGGEKSLTIFVGPEISFWNGETDGTKFNGTIVSAIAGVEYPLSESLDITSKLTLPLSANEKSDGSPSRNLAKTLGISFGVAYRF